jgi:hypothetical protein
MAAVQVQHFLGRARDFLEGMNFLKDDLAFSSALLGIHCAISYCDALRTGMGREKVSSDDHSKAASDLESLLKSRNFENRKGIGHLKKLLGMKSGIEYEPVTVRENEIEDIVRQAERFAEWADATGRKLKIEGW